MRAPRRPMRGKVADVLRLLVLFAVTSAQTGGQCQLSQALTDLFNKKVEEIQVTQGRAEIWVCKLSFLDALTKSAVLAEKSSKLNEAVNDGLRQAATLNPKLKVNAPGHCPADTPANVERLANIIGDVDLNPDERYQKIVKDLLDPTGVDILVSGMVVESQDAIQIRPMAVSRPDKLIKAQNLDPFSTRPGDPSALFDRINGQLFLTKSGRDKISSVVRDLLK